MEQKVDMTEEEVPRGNGGRRTTLHDDAPSSQIEGNSESSGRTGNSKAYEITQEDRNDMRTDTVNYDAQRMIGHGSFGAVFLAKVVETDEVVAIKKVLQDRRFKNRELQIMRQLMKLPHPYIVALRHYFISRGSKPDDVYLNLVLEYVPETLYSVAKHYNKSRQMFPIMSIKLYMYQLARALAHIHGMGICHRDIKPQNLLVDPNLQVLKLCDFGSAKVLVAGEPNVAYICSRYYRAPELIFGSTDYSTAIDVWSQGCVMAELLLGRPIFPGSSGVDQLVEIIKVLGTPTRDELKAMNPNYQEFKFPQIQAQPFSTIFKSQIPVEAIDLCQALLFYVPTRRFKAIEACGHEFFDELRLETTRLPNGSALPMDLYDLTSEELSLARGMEEKLVPEYAVESLKELQGAKAAKAAIAATVADGEELSMSSGGAVNGADGTGDNSNT